MLVDVVAELVSKYGFDLVIRVILQEGVGQEDPAGCAKASERRICLLTFLRQLPFIDAPHTGSSAFTQEQQPFLQFIVFQGLKLVEKREKNDGRNLREEEEERDEHEPGN